MTQLVVSLVAIGSRAKNLPVVVDSLLSQTRRPDKILVYYSAEAWHLDPGWRSAPSLPDSEVVELRCVENLGSCRKYLFAAKELSVSDSMLILVDDDRTWANYVFERLVDFANANDCAATTRGWSDYRLIPDVDGNPILHDQGVKASKIACPVAVEVANSGWATCFRPKHVRAELFDRDFVQLAQMNYSDEIILSSMMETPKYVVPMPKGFYADLSNPAPQWKAPRSTAAKIAQLRLAQNLHVKVIE